jgi:hypothetical protein
MVLRNDDVTRIVAEIPEGHRHLRSTMIGAVSTTITFEEATLAGNLRL